MTIFTKYKAFITLGVFVVQSASVIPAQSLAPSGTAKLIPHRAVYEMSMGEAKRSAGISGLRGRMVFEFSGSACEGYTLNMRLVTQIIDGRGQTTVSDLRSSTWESGEGKRFRFNSSQYLNQRLKEATSGDARRKKSQAIDVKIQKPSRKKLELPEKVLFPTEHSLAVLRAAERGDKILQAPVYDGSENGQKLYSTTTFIGKPTQNKNNKNLSAVENGGKLDGLTWWPVTISYFDQKENLQTTPAYQIAFRLYSNGVSSDLKIEYDDFSMQGALKKIEILNTSDCGIKR